MAELEGLLRLVEKEIHFNELSRLPQLSLSAAGEKNLDKREVGRCLVTSAWQQVRARIAQLLLSSGRFGELASYYQGVQNLNDRLDPLTAPIERQNIPPEAIDLTNQGLAIRRWLADEYLNDSRSAWGKVWRRVAAQLFGVSRRRRSA